MVYHMLVKTRPRSYNAEGRKAYQRRLAQMAVDQNPTMLTGDLYGRIYYFHRGARDIDADNLSKPIMDALRGTVFGDDRQVRLRLAAKVDLEASFAISSETVPQALYGPLYSSVSDPTLRDFVVVEVGELLTVDVRFGQE